MKRLSLIFSAAAVLLATAGVYANAVIATYYVPSYANRMLTGALCELMISTPPCVQLGTPQCTVRGVYSQEPGVSYFVVVSVIVDSGPCNAVKVAN